MDKSPCIRYSRGKCIGQPPSVVLLGTAAKLATICGFVIGELMTMIEASEKPNDMDVSRDADREHC